MADASESLNSTGVPAASGDFFTPSFLEQRRQAIAAADAAAGFQGIDELDPKLPSGHAYAIRKSTSLTSYTKRHQRKAAMDITPQEVIDVLRAAGVKNWVLMGLHGYVGYMPSPRATQDVDVMVPYNERVRAKKAIAAEWPQLVIHELSQVTRFLDPLDLDHEGKPKPVVDIMHPWSPFQELILKEYVLVDGETQHRIPTIEAALVSKYASMVSPYRDRDKKEQDAVDFRRLARANREQVRLPDLRRLAELVWEGGAAEIERFVEIALSDEPFPI
ncbi:MAG: hypothetical protein AB7G28_01025 [Pirellulales bacterium]